MSFCRALHRGLAAVTAECALEDRSAGEWPVADCHCSTRLIRSVNEVNKPVMKFKDFCTWPTSSKRLSADTALS